MSPSRTWSSNPTAYRGPPRRNNGDVTPNAVAPGTPQFPLSLRMTDDATIVSAEGHGHVSPHRYRYARNAEPPDGHTWVCEAQVPPRLMPRRLEARCSQRVRSA